MDADETRFSIDLFLRAVRESTCTKNTDCSCIFHAGLLHTWAPNGFCPILKVHLFAFLNHETFRARIPKRERPSVGISRCRLQMEKRGSDPPCRIRTELSTSGLLCRSCNNACSLSGLLGLSWGTVEASTYTLANILRIFDWQSLLRSTKWNSHQSHTTPCPI